MAQNRNYKRANPTTLSLSKTMFGARGDPFRTALATHSLLRDDRLYFKRSLPPQQGFRCAIACDVLGCVIRADVLSVLSVLSVLRCSVCLL